MPYTVKSEAVTTVKRKSDGQTIMKAHYRTRFRLTESVRPCQMSLYQSRVPLHFADVWIVQQLIAIINFTTDSGNMTLILM